MVRPFARAGAEENAAERDISDISRPNDHDAAHIRMGDGRHRSAPAWRDEWLSLGSASTSRSLLISVPHSHG